MSANDGDRDGLSLSTIAATIVDTLTRAGSVHRSVEATPTASTPEEWLLAAVRAKAPKDRERYARIGLGFEDIDNDTAVLLLRQVYVAAVDERRLDAALDATDHMARLGALPDVTQHDRARVLEALGRRADAIRAQRLAARLAPAKRKSFQLWALATLEHHHGDVDAALATLTRAMRSAVRDRPLLRAYAAYVRLENGLPVRGLAGVVEALRASKNREGYGQFLLGMIAYHMGDARIAAVHLRAFLRRNADVDVAKSMTLAVELSRARAVLAGIDAD